MLSLSVWALELFSLGGKLIEWENFWTVGSVLWRLGVMFGFVL